MLDNILASKLYRPGSVAYVSRSGGMSNELNNIISRTTDGVYEGVAIGGDRYKNLIADHLLENFFIKKKMHKSILESILKKKDSSSRNECLRFSLSRYPGSTFMDHVLRYQDTPGIKMIVVLGEVGSI